MAIIISNRHRDDIVKALTYCAQNEPQKSERRRRINLLIKALQGKRSVSVVDKIKEHNDNTKK